MVSDYKKQIAHWFDQRTYYDDDFTRYRALRLVQLTQQRLHPSQCILDVATGTGIVAIAISPTLSPKGQIIGVDLSSGMLNQANSKIIKEKIKNIQLIQADIEEMNFDIPTFDGIYCSSALVLLSDVTKALQTWYHWLKKDGFLAFTCYSPDSFFCPMIIRICAENGFKLRNIHEGLGKVEKCREQLQAIGFKDIQVETEQLGKYMTIKEAQQAWRGDWVDSQGHSLSEITDQEKERLIQQFRQEISQKATIKGFWQELKTFFVIASK